MANSAPLPIRVAAYSHRGRRENNEDSVYGAAYRSGPVRGLLVVADGMGGHNAGEVASTLAVDTLISSLKKNLKTLSGKGQVDLNALTRDIVVDINQGVHKAQTETEERKGMGTTLCFALLTHDGYFVTNVGDSRAYLVEEEGVRQITHDHTFYWEMIRSGKVTPEEAARNPRAHHITRSIGGPTEPSPDIFPSNGGLLPLRDGQVLLLCTDGLVNTIIDEEILEQLKSSPNLSLACHNLVSLAYLKGGTDNISLVAAEVGDFPRTLSLSETLPSIDSITRSLVVRQKRAEVKVRRLKFEIFVLIGLLIYILFVLAVLFFMG
jgi:serine/threonine protein phosphatase PrpC